MLSVSRAPSHTLLSSLLPCVGWGGGLSGSQPNEGKMGPREGGGDRHGNPIRHWLISLLVLATPGMDGAEELSGQ